MGEPRQLLVTEAETRVVVDEADGLHVRIDRHRAEELETARSRSFSSKYGQRIFFMCCMLVCNLCSLCDICHDDFDNMRNVRAVAIDP